MEFVRKIPVYEEWDIEECFRVTGAPPVSTKWVDKRKGSGVRSRWVARDFKPRGDDGREDLFAGMPPREAKKALFKLAAKRATGRGTRRGEKMKLLFIDVRKAYFIAKVDRPTYVEVPEEIGKTGYCGRLNRCMYGTRPAGTGLGETYTQEMKKL